jgi:hypothetical protein
MRKIAAGKLTHIDHVRPFLAQLQVNAGTRIEYLSWFEDEPTLPWTVRQAVAQRVKADRDA